MHAYTAVISSLAHEYIPILERDYDVLTLPPDISLDVPVRCHADMLLFAVGKKVVMPAAYVETYPYIAETLISRCGFEVLTTTAERRSAYPYDIALNVLLCSSYAFSLKRYTALEVTKLIESSAFVHENIRQGYAACSTLATDNCLITADPSVLRAAQKCGIDILEISAGNIKLRGYAEGFIGGASGICEKNVYFLGNIMTHPDGEKIREFITTHGFDVISLGNGELYDFGGIKFFKNLNSGF